MVATSQKDLEVSVQLAAELRPLILRLGRHLRTRAVQAGSSAMDAQLLSIIQLIPGLGVTDLAEVERMSKAAMSAHIKRLLDLKLIERSAATPDQDRRTAALRITAAGEELMADVSAHRTEWMRDRLTALSGEQLSALVDALGILHRMNGPEIIQLLSSPSTL